MKKIFMQAWAESMDSVAEDLDRYGEVKSGEMLAVGWGLIAIALVFAVGADGIWVPFVTCFLGAAGIVAFFVDKNTLQIIAK